MWKCEAIVLASRIALCSKAATATAGGFLAGRGNQLPLGRTRELSGTQRGVQRAQITHCTYKSRGARAMPNTRAKTPEIALFPLPTWSPSSLRYAFQLMSVVLLEIYSVN